MKVMQINDAKFKNISNYKNEVDEAETVIMKNCTTTNIYHGMYIPMFFRCKTLVFKNNSLSFCFYYLNKVIFPNVEKIYFHGEDIDDIFLRFPCDTWTVTKETRLKKKYDFKEITINELERIIDCHNQEGRTQSLGLIV